MKLTDQEITLMQTILGVVDNTINDIIQEQKPLVEQYFALANKDDTSKESQDAFYVLNNVKDNLRHMRKKRKIISDLNKKLKQMRKTNQG
jgi:multidrug efflux pump subunit AcrB